MEFSFDRSKGAQAQSNAQSVDGPRPGPDLNSVDPSTIANERLRKAIERNRAKQAERDFARPAAPKQHYEAPPQTNTTQENHQQASFFANAAAAAQAQANMHAQHSQDQTPLQEAPRARENIRPRSTSVVSRRTTAKPDDTEFVPVKRTPRKVAAQISYATGSASTLRKKNKSMDPKYVTWFVKGSWIFCALMVLRLIFAAGGVTDYYSQKSSVNARADELKDIKKDNMSLVREIERMRSDVGFQKKLVRDNLGFIASDEFLILFPKGK